MAIDKTKDFFLGAIDNLRDPFRTTRWRAYIPGDVFVATGISPTNGDTFGNIEGESDFALHIKSAKIPDISIANGKVDYMGFESFYPIKATIGGEQQFTAILLEDLRAYEAVLAWEQNLINTGLLVDGSNKDRTGQTGLELGLGNHKVPTNPTSQVIRNQNIRIELYNWMNGDLILRMNLINAWPSKVSGLDLKYDNATLAMFNFTLRYDRHTIFIPEKYKTGKGAGTDAFGR